MKTCSRCKETKDVSLFVKESRKPDGCGSRCRRCAAEAMSRYVKTPTGRASTRAYRAARREKLRALVNSYKNVPCADCGQWFPLICMDFDHLGNKPKEGEISTMVHRLTSEKRILAEIAKCEVVCSNCHRIRTFDRRQYEGAV